MAESYPIEFGNYRLLRKVAQGGMAEIFLAQDPKGEICAIKRILPHLAHEESFIRMFIDEARIVSHIRHPNVAQVYDQGKSAGYYYIAMEFVQGHSLLALSERAKSVKMDLPRGLLAYIVAELLAGLASAHAARDAKGRHLGIVHRDVTPQNVLISYDGSVKLIDFGVAKARARLTQTEAGFTKGKLSYMSPEQARGEELDARSDLFSVGIVAHEITTGSRLFNKEGPGGILGAIVNDPIPPPSLRSKNYPKELEGIVMKALEKDVDKRWQSADEMRDALLRFAKKEKPAPGRPRLKDLVHDLFGAPESQKIIDAAKAVIAPTPARVPVHQEELVRGASVRVKGNELPDTPAQPEEAVDPVVGHRSVIARKAASQLSQLIEQPPADETRMLRPDYELSGQRSKLMPKLEVTSEGTPVLDLRALQDASAVPEPEVPLRLKIARFITALAQDARVSWRTHKKRYLAGAAGLLAMITLVVLWKVGAVAAAWAWVGGAAEKAKELKSSAGFGAQVDAGVRPTVLRLVTEPPGASIVIDGFGVGSVTPHELPNLELGRPLKVELRLPGYRPKVEKITLVPDDGVKEIAVKLEKMAGTIVVESDPPGAIVVRDGKPVEGRTPLKIEGVDAGERVKLSISKDGRLPRDTVVEVADGEEKVVSVELPVDVRKIPSGYVTVTTSPPGCALLVDDQPVGRAPLEKHALRPGPHSVTARCEHHAEETRAVSIGPGQTSNVSFALSANVFGYLTINPIPFDGSTVEINGQKVSLPVEFKKVVPGRHNVVVSNARLRARREISVDVPANARVTRDVNLAQ
ncbi:PEGA domain-containing protein [Myxococcota bacterium]|nr:PEGA domain-containing protein [Myxococcota bacterium]